MNKFALIFIALSVAVMTQISVAQTSSTLVVPGKSLGRIHLGFTQAQVHKILGKPDKTLKLKNGLTDDLYKAKKTRITEYGSVERDKIEILYKGGKVVQIEATSPAFRTSNGLSTATTLRTLEKTLKPVRFHTYGYGKPDESGAQNYYVDQVHTGIAFEYGKTQDSWFWSNGSGTIIVHRKGVSVIPDEGGEFISTKAWIEGDD